MVRVGPLEGSYDVIAISPISFSLLISRVVEPDTYFCSSLHATDARLDPGESE